MNNKVIASELRKIANLLQSSNSLEDVRQIRICCNQEDPSIDLFTYKLKLCDKNGEVIGGSANEASKLYDIINDKLRKFRGVKPKWQSLHGYEVKTYPLSKFWYVISTAKLWYIDYDCAVTDVMSIEEAKQVIEALKFN